MCPRAWRGILSATTRLLLGHGALGAPNSKPASTSSGSRDTRACTGSASACLGRCGCFGSMFPQEATRWQYLGEDAGLSRLYGGIHYPSNEWAGNQMDKSLTALAIQRDQLTGP